MKKVLLSVSSVFIFMLICTGAYAQEENSNLNVEDLDTLLYEEEEIIPYEFPEIRPEFKLSVGYRFVDESGARSAIDYDYLKDSVPFAIEARVYPFPHRVHLVFDWMNEKDYFGEIRYAYGDRVFFRSINRMLFHNLTRVTLAFQDLPDVDFDIRDSGIRYGVKTAINSYFLRLKPSDLAVHAFFDYWTLHRKGREQDVSLLGSGSFTDALRTSQQRETDLTTREYTAGLNGHLGPYFEAQYSHTGKDLNVEGDRVLIDFYRTGTALLGPGTFPHGLISEQEGSTDTVKLHTSYHGKLFATATLSVKDRENSESGAEADYFVGKGGLMWMPDTSMTFFLRYSHSQVDVDNPTSATLTDLNNPANSFTFAAKPSVESSTDTVSLTARYRPLRRLTLRAGYTYENVDRDNADAWNLSDTTEKNIFHAAADSRLPWGLGVDVDYTYTEVEDPSYNIDPDYSNAGAVEVTWNPVPTVNTLISYNIKNEKRKFLRFEGTSRARNREVDSNRVMGVATFLVGGNVSLTASYAFTLNEVEQDLVFEDLSGPLAVGVDEGVEYEDKSHTFSFDVSYSPVQRLNLSSGITYTKLEADFSPTEPDLTQPESIASFSQSDVNTTVVTAAGEYRSRGGYGIGVEYKFEDLEEELENTFDDIEEGEAHIVLLTLSKSWK